ncbi:hypothetical protein BDZ89DRAFT_1223266 [Hymenopellis radicata]|nr:hypothetical protein BDZ89DRAFT_1223266 [Hymenopellis radicata]
MQQSEMIDCCLWLWTAEAADTTDSMMRLQQAAVMVTGLETSTSHRVTESSGDSTRFGHVGVRTRVTRESYTRESEHESKANGPQRLENETPEATRQRLIEWYFSVLDLHHDHHHHPGSDDCRSRCSDDCQAACLGLETSTSHRVTESSGDSTRVGHVGVRTRMTQQTTTTTTTTTTQGVTIVAPAALTIVRQPVGCGFVIWICAGPAAAGPAPVADLENE